jgi:UDP-3-O-[3-hydroxymyristoyl] N-acetylglucosamine deacetylase
MRKGVLISTTEHILSALIGSGIDNVAIEIDSLELPIVDGSGKTFVEMIQKAGKRRQSAPRKFLRVLRPVEVVEGYKRISIYPDKGFRIRSTVEFPHPLVGSQEMEINLTEQNYSSEIAPARTFGFLAELPQMRNMGLIRGASLENAICFTGDGVMNANGLRYPDEPCRHKILDLIGDLALIGHPLRAFVDAERAGHAMHTALVLKLVKDRSLWELTTSDEPALDRTTLAVPSMAYGEAMSD